MNDLSSWASTPIDRCSMQRHQPAFVRSLQRQKTAHCLYWWDQGFWLSESTDLLFEQPLKMLNPSWFLGTVDNQPIWLTASSIAPAPDATWHALRSLVPNQSAVAVEILSFVKDDEFRPLVSSCADSMLVT